MTLRTRLFAAGFALAFSATAFGSDTAAAPAVDPALDRQVEAARGLLYARKSAALNAVMHLTAEQQAAFNPVLSAYDNELMKLGDRRIALIREFAGYYNTQSLDDKNAKRLVHETIKCKQDQLKLVQRYFDKASKVIGVRKASEWVQVENAFISAVDTKLALLMPVLSDAMKE